MRTILVDDHPAYLAALAQLVQRQPGIEIVGRAYSGKEGLKLAQALQPELVLVDFSMPDMNGAQVAQALKAGPAPPRVIVVSNHDEQEYRDKAFSSGADGYALKSELESELLPLLKRLLA
jgi:DNA-binding NarL/FixJ family response regulator